MQLHSADSSGLISEAERRGREGDRGGIGKTGGEKKKRENEYLRQRISEKNKFEGDPRERSREKLTNCARLCSSVRLAHLASPLFSPPPGSTTNVLFLTVSLFDIDRAFAAGGTVVVANSLESII